MVNDFQLTISTDDFLVVINNGIKQMTFGDLIERADKVTRIEYSRDTKRYTLVFTSGKKLKVIAEGRKFVDDVIASTVNKASA